jgi:hypothetical protein
VSFTNKVLSDLDPKYLLKYVSDHGWAVDGGSPHFIFYVKAVDGFGEVNLEIPINQDLRDYAHRVSELLVDLETIERRSRYDIFMDIIERRELELRPSKPPSVWRRFSRWCSDFWGSIGGHQAP